MALTWATVVLIAPELSVVPAGTQNLILGWTAAEVTITSWGTTARAERAQAYLAAHLGTLAKTGSGSGAGSLQSVQVGAVSKTYAVSMASDASSLTTTGYGKEYLRLLKQVNMRWAVT